MGSATEGSSPRDNSPSGSDAEGSVGPSTSFPSKKGPREEPQTSAARSIPDADEVPKEHSKVIAGKYRVPSRVTPGKLSQARAKMQIGARIPLRAPQPYERADWSSDHWTPLFVESGKYLPSLPLPPLIAGLCRRFDVAPGQWMPYAWRLAFAVEVYNAVLRISLSVDDILYTYYPLRHKPSGLFSLQNRKSKKSLIIGEVNDRNWWKDFVFVHSSSLTNKDPIRVRWNPTDQLICPNPDDDERVPVVRGGEIRMVSPWARSRRLTEKVFSLDNEHRTFSYLRDVASEGASGLGRFRKGGVVPQTNFYSYFCC